MYKHHRNTHGKDTKSIIYKTATKKNRRRHNVPATCVPYPPTEWIPPFEARTRRVTSKNIEQNSTLTYSAPSNDPVITNNSNLSTASLESSTPPVPVNDQENTSIINNDKLTETLQNNTSDDHFNLEEFLTEIEERVNQRKNYWNQLFNPSYEMISTPHPVYPDDTEDMPIYTPSLGDFLEEDHN